MTKRFIRPFETGQIGLRLLASEDLPTTLAWRNQDRVRKQFITSQALTPEEHLAWFESYANKDDDFVFLFSNVLVPARPVGQVSLYRIDWTRKTATFGRLLVGEETFLHRGFAKAATRAILTMAFNQFKLDSVSLEVYEDNAPAVHIYRRVGFLVTRSERGLMSMTLQKERYAVPGL